MCIRGGLEVPTVLGSASAHLVTGLGGRALRKDDLLAIGDTTAGPTRQLRTPVLIERAVLRVTSGPQRDWFSESLGSYTVSEKCDRMGIRLTGTPLTCTAARELLTEGVSLGAIQSPPDGQPIILFVEHQTTGGYPKIANVISADLCAAGQLRPRDKVWFEEVSIERALGLLRQLEDFLRSLST
jgi:allophanate hydrolase subunit 2